jgi:phage FluMu protein Com
MLEKYKASGVLTSKFFVGAPIVLVAAAILGAIYQVLQHYIPLIYANAALAVGMGFATGYLVTMLSKTTHSRNMAAGAGLGLIASVLAVCVSHWIEYEMANTNYSFFENLQQRANAGWTIGHGSSTSGGPTISGIGVYIVWMIEAALIVGFGVAGGIRGATRPYCEACGAWADYDMLKVTIPEPSEETVANVKAAMTPAALVPPPSAMIPPPPPPPPTDPKEAKKLAKAAKKAWCMRYAVTSCPRCKMFHTLTVEHEVVVTQGKKAEKKAVKLHEDVLLSSLEVGQLAQLKAPAATPAPAAG